VTHAVLQRSLDTPLRREDLETALLATRTLTRPDGVRLHRELFGIVAGGLAHDEALALRAALEARGFPCEVVAEERLPVLAEPMRGLILDFDAEAFVQTDMYGRQQRYELADTVFLAGGFVKVWANRAEEKLASKMVPRGKLLTMELVSETKRTMVEAEEFRLELFIAREPWRWQWTVGEKTGLRVNGRLYQMRDRWPLREVLQQLQALAPAERVNRGIAEAGVSAELVYPSVRAFEEEIVWRFYQLTRATE